MKMRAVQARQIDGVEARDRSPRIASSLVAKTFVAADAVDEACRAPARRRPRASGCTGRARRRARAARRASSHQQLGAGDVDEVDRRCRSAARCAARADAPRASRRARRGHGRPRRRRASRRRAAARAAGIRRVRRAAAATGIEAPLRRRRIGRDRVDRRMRRPIEVDEQRAEHADQDREVELHEQRREKRDRRAPALRCGWRGRSRGCAGSRSGPTRR